MSEENFDTLVNLKFSYLKMIQDVITRMASNSFYVKGWCVTIFAATFLFILQNLEFSSMFVLIFLIMSFWYLDAYFLYQERMYRDLYDYVRNLEASNAFLLNFSLNPFNVAEKEKSSKSSQRDAFFSKTLILFYGPMILILLLLVISG